MSTIYIDHKVSLSPQSKIGKSKLDKTALAFNFVRTSCEDQDNASCT